MHVRSCCLANINLSPVQTDATWHCWPTTPNIVGCYILRPFAHPLGCCCVLLRKVWNRSNFSASDSQHFFSCVIAETKRNNVGSVCTTLPTLLGPRTLITHALQRLMGCMLPTMHCRFQHCWELLHPFAHHCQHARNNSQHCWRNNVGSCCVRLHAALWFFTFLVAVAVVIRDLKIRRRRRQRERHKSNRFNWQNNNFARVSRFFVHFFAVTARLRRENT